PAIGSSVIVRSATIAVTSWRVTKAASETAGSHSRSTKSRSARCTKAASEAAGRHSRSAKTAHPRSTHTRTRSAAEAAHPWMSREATGAVAVVVVFQGLNLPEDFVELAVDLIHPLF